MTAIPPRLPTDRSRWLTRATRVLSFASIYEVARSVSSHATPRT